jgi:hypothetical protein
VKRRFFLYSPRWRWLLPPSCAGGSAWGRCLGWARYLGLVCCVGLCLSLLIFPLARYVPTVVLPAESNCTCASHPAPAYTAVMLETRASPGLEFAVRHMACSLPDDWGIMLVVPRGMRGFLRAAFGPLLRSHRLVVWELSQASQDLQQVCPQDGGGGGGGEGSWCTARATAPAWRVPRSPAFDKWTTGWDLANQVMLSEPLFRAIPSDRFLMFQTDGLLCRALTASDISALERFDYIGAPWRWDPLGVALFGAVLLPSSRAAAGGNGGFSFRTRAVILRILEEEKKRQWFDAPLAGGPGDWEDMFYSRRIAAAGGRLPPHDFATSFAVESILPVGGAPPLGFHNPWKYLSETDLKTLSRMCPAISESLAWANASLPQSCRDKGSV